jgi:predicted nucleotidyltransferase
MRLSPDQTRAIVTATRAVAGERAQIKLFGSRLDDQARGGDIDLLVEVPEPVAQPAWLAARITASVQRALGDRKIDVVLIDPRTQLQPVHRQAQNLGVLLT